MDDIYIMTFRVAHWDDSLARGVHCTKHVRVYVSAQKGY